VAPIFEHHPDAADERLPCLPELRAYHRLANPLQAGVTNSTPRVRFRAREYYRFPSSDPPDGTIKLFSALPLCDDMWICFFLAGEHRDSRTRRDMVVIECEGDQVIRRVDRILEKVRQAAVGTTQQPAC
jgi:hypothetical protein